ncbi:MAG: hypothetical protein WBV82_08620 [Myxococcaceae bacterium]
MTVSAPLLLAVSALAVAQVSNAPDPLQNARRLSDELRYEEAVVEYQRYLALSGRAMSERSRALIELGFIHLVLGDELNAETRAFEALELDPALKLPSDAPSRLEKFLVDMRDHFEARTRIEILPPEDPKAPQRIRARVENPAGTVRQVLLRHALGSTGPWYAQPMRCDGALCIAEIPTPQGSASFTAWYYVEANDAEGNTVGRGASPQAPLRVSIVDDPAWYRSPWVYAGGAAALVGGAAVFFLLSPTSR